MNTILKENTKHGTKSYAFAQYHMYNLEYAFYTPFHWHDEIEIIYVKKGRLQVTINNTEYEGISGDIFLVNPREIHKMTTDNLKTDYYTILFPLELISFDVEDDVEEKYFRPIREGDMLFINHLKEHVLYKKILECVLNIIEANELQKEMYQFETKINILQIMYLLLKNTSLIQIRGNGKNIMLQRDILSYIDRRYTEKISLKDIADNFHMSEKYFSRFFKNCFQVTFVEYVNSVRLEKAASLLTTTDSTVTEVALQCGFTNISYFIRSFKKFFGKSPHVYRSDR